MIRLIVKEIDVFPDGQTSKEYKTFDVEISAVEAFLREKIGYMHMGKRVIVSGIVEEKED